MHSKRLRLLLLLGELFGFLAQAAAPPIRLHPDNPRYFLWRGQPTVLITSGEHYGAVLNLDFDFARYLEELKAHRFNLTRTFLGAYREVPGSFNITGNTLAPASGRFACPWARSESPGASDGGNKFDLTRWDPTYFERLKDFLTQAGDRGIVVVESFDLLRMAPHETAVLTPPRTTSAGDSQPAARPTVRVLAEVGKAYAVYINGGTQTQVALELPAGGYRAEWVSTLTGRVEKREDFIHPGGDRTLASPAYAEDIALRLRRTPLPRSEP